MAFIKNIISTIITNIITLVSDFVAGFSPSLYNPRQWILNGNDSGNNVYDGMMGGKAVYTSLEDYDYNIKPPGAKGTVFKHTKHTLRLPSLPSGEYPQITIAARIKLSTLANWNIIFGGGGPNGSGISLGVYPNTGNLFCGNAGAIDQEAALEDIDINSWWDVGVRFESDTATFYKKRSLASSGNSAARPVNSALYNGGYIWHGTGEHAPAFGGYSSFSSLFGQIKMAAVWSGWCTNSQLDDWFGHKDVVLSGLQCGFWMDEEEGDIYYDYSGNEYHGVSVSGIRTEDSGFFFNSNEGYGFNLSGNVYIPEDQSNKGFDVFGNTLTYHSGDKFPFPVAARVPCFSGGASHWIDTGIDINLGTEYEIDFAVNPLTSFFFVPIFSANTSDTSGRLFFENNLIRHRLASTEAVFQHPFEHVTLNWHNIKIVRSGLTVACWMNNIQLPVSGTLTENSDFIFRIIGRRAGSYINGGSLGDIKIKSSGLTSHFIFQEGGGGRDLYRIFEDGSYNIYTNGFQGSNLLAMKGGLTSGQVEDWCSKHGGNMLSGAFVPGLPNSNLDILGNTKTLLPGRFGNTHCRLDFNPFNSVSGMSLGLERNYTIGTNREIIPPIETKFRQSGVGGEWNYFAVVGRLENFDIDNDWNPGNKITLDTLFDGSVSNTINHSGNLTHFWQEITRNGRDLVGSGTYRPWTNIQTINSKNVIYFSGGQHLRPIQSNFKTISQPLTEAVVMKAYGLPSSGTRSVITDTGSQSGIHRCTLSINNLTGTPRLGLNAGTEVTVNSFVFASGQDYKIITVLNGSDSEVYINGSGYTLSGNPGSNSLTLLTLGSNFSGSSEYLNGSIAEVNIFAEELQGGDLANEINYLEEKW